MKVCKRCKEEKDFCEFSVRTARGDGLDSWCKNCYRDASTKRNRTKKGKLKVIYSHQVQKSRERNHYPPTYTKKEFVNRYLNDLDFERHYYSWVISNYSKDYSPSFDRKDDYKGYSFDNIQIMYWFENNKKHNLERKNGVNNKASKAVVGTNIKTGEKIEFFSMSEAGRNGFNFGNISNCCIGNVKSSGGYVWVFKENIKQ